MPVLVTIITRYPWGEPRGSVQRWRAVDGSLHRTRRNALRAR